MIHGNSIRMRSSSYDRAKGRGVGRLSLREASIREPLGEEEALCSCTWASLLSLSIEGSPTERLPDVEAPYVEAPMWRLLCRGRRSLRKSLVQILVRILVES